MAKSDIRKLKERRFWRWVCVEVYGKPEPKNPIKKYARLSRRWKLNRRKLARSHQKLMAMIDKQLAAGNVEVKI